MSHVAWSACLCVGLTGVPRNNVLTDRDTVWGLTRVGPRNHYYMRVEIPTKWTILGLVPYIGGFLLRYTQQMDQLVLNNGITADCNTPD